MSARCPAELVVGDAAARCAKPVGHDGEHDGVTWHELAELAETFGLPQQVVA